jgi:hypothetical protein
MRSRTLVNPRPYAVRLVLSDGTQRIVGPWGLVILPPVAQDGGPLEIVLAELVFHQVIAADNAA